MHNSNKFCWSLLACLIVRGAMADAPPTGKLPDDVKPLAYTLNMKIDPRADRFSGRVHIRVKLTEPLDHIWLHASEIDVDRIEEPDAIGTGTKAHFETADKSGGAEVSFDG